MIDRSETIAESSACLPPILRAEQESAPLARGPWYLTIGPAYLGIFVWAPFFDSLWIGDLTRFPLPWLIGSAVFASLLCFGLLYYIPAIVGVSDRTAAGNRGGFDLWHRRFGMDHGGRGRRRQHRLVRRRDRLRRRLDLARPARVRLDRGRQPAARGTWARSSSRARSISATALFWIYITGTAGLWKMPGVVVALMRVYAPVALLLLTAVALWLLPNLGLYRIETRSMIVEQTQVCRSVARSSARPCSS